MISIYLHFPFCVRKCGYCDFVSRAPAGEGEIERYIEFLLLEIRLAAMSPGIAGREARTIYFGGGTPSLMSLGQIEIIMAALRDNFAISPAAEISMESNPGSQSSPEEWLTGARNLGINRLVVGIQSMSGEKLKFLGRIHDKEQAMAFYSAARSAGFCSVGVDLIYGLPEQTVDEWKRDLNEIIGLEPDHVSIYCLEIHHGTPLGKRLAAGEFREADGALQAEMYHAARGLLEGAGLRAYEISNFAVPGRECAHNLAYWTGGDYLGVGIAASSHIGGWRWENEREMEKYAGKIEHGMLPRRAGEFLSSRRRLRESAIMALRTAAGFRPGEYRAAHERELESELEKLAVEGHLEKADGGCYRLRPEYRFVSDAVFSRIVG